MAIGLWQDPQTGQKVPMYADPADVPSTHPQGERMAFASTAGLSESGRCLLAYYQAQSSYHPTVMVSSFPVVMTDKPVWVGAPDANGMVKITVRTESAKMLGDDIGGPTTQLAWFVIPIVIAILCATVAVISYFWAWSIVGPEQEATERAGYIAESLKPAKIESFDLNGDGVDDKQVTTYNNGDVYETPLSDYGVEVMNTSTGILTKEGYDWEQFSPISQWGNLLLYGAVAVGAIILGVVTYKYVESKGGVVQTVKYVGGRTMQVAGKAIGGFGERVEGA